MLQAPVGLWITWELIFARWVTRFSNRILVWHPGMVMLLIKFLVHETWLLSGDETGNRGGAIAAVSLSALNCWEQVVNLVSNWFAFGFIILILDEFTCFIWGQKIWWASIFYLISNLVQLGKEGAIAGWARRWRGHCFEWNAHGCIFIDALKIFWIFAIIECTRRLS